MVVFFDLHRTTHESTLGIQLRESNELTPTYLMRFTRRKLVPLQSFVVTRGNKMYKLTHLVVICPNNATKFDNQIHLPMQSCTTSCNGQVAMDSCNEQLFFY